VEHNLPLALDTYICRNFVPAGNFLQSADTHPLANQQLLLSAKQQPEKCLR
jgi:hypothetical protein